MVKYTEKATDFQVPLSSLVVEFPLPVAFTSLKNYYQYIQAGIVKCEQINFWTKDSYDKNLIIKFLRQKGFEPSESEEVMQTSKVTKIKCKNNASQVKIELEYGKANGEVHVLAEVIPSHPNTDSNPKAPDSQPLPATPDGEKKN